MTVKNFSIRQKIGEKCISKNAPIIPVSTGQKLVLCLLLGTCLTVPMVFSQRLCVLRSQGWGLEKILGSTDFIFSGSKIAADSDCSHKIKRHLLLGRKTMIKLDSILKQRHHFLTKSCIVKAMVFSSSHVQMWELDHKEGWVRKN